jgi:hypothetical protein
MNAETAVPGARWAWLSLWLAIGATSGCTSLSDQSDYHRHSMSDLREDWRRPGILLFEATSSGQFPADSESGEAARMKWLAGWMKRSGHCPDGWEVLSRAPIDPAEVHSRRHDLRYEVRCIPPDGARPIEGSHDFTAPADAQSFHSRLRGGAATGQGTPAWRPRVTDEHADG